MTNSNLTLSPEILEPKIYIIRNKKVMIDKDLAELYGVLTKTLNQAVRRNISRFPEDFMFQMNKTEMENWKSQIVTSNRVKMGLRKSPLVFTEQGIAMLSSVLRSERAIHVNIQIMRTFTKIREMMVNNKDLQQRIDKLEEKFDGKFKVVFNAINALLTESEEPKSEMGFKQK